MKRAFLKFGDPESIKTRDAGESEDASPLEQMHASFGKKPERPCGACKHFRQESYFETKCAVYHLYHPESIGIWQSSWEGCGKWARR